MNQEQREQNTAILEWFDAIIVALSLVLIILLFVFRTVTVDGISMLPTLEDGQQVIARSILYTPQRGDVVVIDGHTAYGQPIIKRVIGVGGDEVDINFDTGQVFVNGEALDESAYTEDLMAQSYDVTFPVIVPQGTVFLMGDNRPNSLDSRHSDIGFIDERDILGEVVFRILPLEDFGAVK